MTASAFTKFSTAAAIAALALDACSGSNAVPLGRTATGGGGTTPGGGSTGSSAARTAHVSGTVKIPAAPKSANGAARRSTGFRTPQYLSTATNSLTFVQGGSSTLVPLTPSSPNCTANGDGSRSCTFDAPAIPGTNVAYTVSTFANASGTGTPLSIANMTAATITAGATNPITLTLSPVLGSLTVAAPASFVSGGGSQTATVTVDALDPSGATIATGVVGLVDATGNPVTVSLASSSGAVTLDPTTLTTGSTSTLTYGGSGAAGNVTVTATASTAANPSLATAMAAVDISAGNSLYVLDGGNMRIVEYALASDGTLAANATPRRVIDMPQPNLSGNALCMSTNNLVNAQGVTSDLASGISVDPAGNVFVMLYCTTDQTATTLGPSVNGYIYEYGPNSVSTTGITTPVATFLGPAFSPALVFDAQSSSSSTDTFVTHPTNPLNGLQDGNGVPIPPNEIDAVSLSPAATPTTALQATSIARSAINGYPGHAQNTTVGGSTYVSTYTFDLDGTSQQDFDALTVANGSVYVPFAIFGGGSFSGGNYVPPPAEIPALANVAGQGAVFRFDRPLTAYAPGGSANAPAGAVVGASTGLPLAQNNAQLNTGLLDGMSQTSTRLDLLVVGTQTSQSVDSTSEQVAITECLTPPTLALTAAPNACADTDSHDYIISYPLSSASAATASDASMGLDDVPFTFAIGANPANASGLSSTTSGPGNRIASFGNFIYLANPTGPNGSTSTSSPPFTGELDVYNVGGLTGISNSVMPAVIKNPNFAPTSVVVGVQGSATGGPALSTTNALRRMSNVIRRQPHVRKR